MTENNSLFHLNLETQPDCVRSFPFENNTESDLFGSLLVSCYQYDENSHDRNGSLLYLNPTSYLESKLSPNNTPQNEPKVFYFGQDLGGIMSCSWTMFQDGFGLSCISSKLKIAQFLIDTIMSDLSPRVSGYKFIKINEINLSDGLLSTSPIALNFSTSDDKASSFCVTCSDGTAFVVKDNNILSKWKPHQLETWTSSFHPSDSNLLLTGSDDSTVKSFDLRSGTDPLSTLSCHSSGVTTIQFFPNNPYLFYTGGFDKLLVKHDFRNLNKPLESLITSTPVWYIDFLSDSNSNVTKLHVSGCHDGSAIYDSSGSLLSSFKPNNCLIYSTSHFKLSSTVFCSCDFYSKSLHFYT